MPFIYCRCGTPIRPGDGRCSKCGGADFVRIVLYTAMAKNDNDVWWVDNLTDFDVKFLRLHKIDPGIKYEEVKK